VLRFEKVEEGGALRYRILGTGSYLPLLQYPSVSLLPGAWCPQRESQPGLRGRCARSQLPKNRRREHAKNRSTSPEPLTIPSSVAVPSSYRDAYMLPLFPTSSRRDATYSTCVNPNLGQPRSEISKTPSSPTGMMQRLLQWQPVSLQRVSLLSPFPPSVLLIFPRPQQPCGRLHQ
jgi:hypothetical protein